MPVTANYNHDKGKGGDMLHLDSHVCFFYLYPFILMIITLFLYLQVAHFQPGTTTCVSYYLFLLVSLITTIYRTHNYYEKGEDSYILIFIVYTTTNILNVNEMSSRAHGPR